MLSLAARPVHPVWLGYAAYLHGDTTGAFDRASHYHRSGAAVQAPTSQLNESDALQACGMLHLSAGLATVAQADHGTTATHLTEASALVDRLGTEIGTWARLWFGPTNLGIWRTSLAVELGEHVQAVQVAKTVHSASLTPPAAKPCFSPRSAEP